MFVVGFLDGNVGGYCFKGSSGVCLCVIKVAASNGAGVFACV